MSTRVRWRHRRVAASVLRQLLVVHQLGQGLARLAPLAPGERLSCLGRVGNGQVGAPMGFWGDVGIEPFPDRLTRYAVMAEALTRVETINPASVRAAHGVILAIASDWRSLAPRVTVHRPELGADVASYDRANAMTAVLADWKDQVAGLLVQSVTVLGDLVVYLEVGRDELLEGFEELHQRIAGFVEGTGGRVTDLEHRLVALERLAAERGAAAAAPGRDHGRDGAGRADARPEESRAPSSEDGRPAITTAARPSGPPSATRTGSGRGEAISPLPKTGVSPSHGATVRLAAGGR